MSDDNKDFNPEVAPPAEQQPQHEEMNPHDAAPPSVPPAEVKQPAPAEGTGPSLDHNLHDSLGNAKTAENAEGVHEPITEPEPIGPRGANVSPEHLSEPAKKESAAAEHARLTQGMSSTDSVDSIGNAKGEFRVEAQGFDKHGARIPDHVTDELVEEHQPMVGPRGQGAPLDSWHGTKSK